MSCIGLDLSTKTGFVQLDDQGEVLTACEISYKQKDPERMKNLIDDIQSRITYGDTVVIEGFSFGSKGKGVAFQYGLGWGVRMALFDLNLEYKIIAPGGLKKFVSGKGNAKKDQMAIDIYKRWGFEHPSDNVRDAYALAQVGRALRGLYEPTKFQQEALKKVTA